MPSNATPEVRVSVVIATYNRAHYLPEALGSILNQTRPPEEIIVVDDGSTDQTVEVLKHYGNRIRAFRTGNRGKAAALNFAIPLAQGTHIWIFDDDDVALPEALRSHVDFLMAHPEADFTYSSNYRYTGNGNIWQRTTWASKTVPDYSPDTLLVRTMQGMHTMLQGMLIPKRCLLAVGPFDESLLRVQDHEMLIRLAYFFRGRNILVPTFVMRDHGGARGPGTHGHTPAQRASIQLGYQQALFRKIRDSYELAIYLPREPGTSMPVLGEAEHGRALIQRSCIMLRQGLVDEALEDLAAGLDHLKPVRDSMGGMGAMLAKALDVDPRRFQRPFQLVLRLGKILRAADADALAFPLTRGLYWRIRHSIRQHLWFEAVVSAAMLCVMALGHPTAMLKRKGTVIDNLKQSADTVIP